MELFGFSSSSIFESDPKSKTAKVNDHPTWLYPRYSGSMAVIQRLTANQMTWKDLDTHCLRLPLP
jgi:hypothetical protein